MDRPGAAIVIVTFHHREMIGRCLDAVLATARPGDEIVVVDNASGDGTAEAAAAAGPRVRVVRSAENLGYAGAGDLAATSTAAPHLVFLNPDTRPHTGWLDALQDALALPSAGLVGPLLVRASDPARVDALGVDVHLTGIPTSRCWDEPVERHAGVEEVAAVSGACFAVRRDVFDALGGFDRRAWYMEDVALSLRARLAGYRCLVTSAARVEHVHPPGVWPAKLFYIERSRWWLLLVTFHWRTLLGLAPALLVGEIVSWAFALSSGPGHAGAKARACLGAVRWLRDVPAARRAAPARRVSDRALLRRHRTRLAFAQVRGGAVRLLGEPLAALAFSLTRPIAEALAR